MPVQTDSNSRRGILLKTTPADEGLVKLPALTPHLQFHDIGEQETLLVSESFNTLLHGKLHHDLLPLLDGRRALDEIVAALDGAHARADVLAAMAALSAKGYVVSADHGMDRGRAAYWSSLGASPRWAEQRLARSRTAVEGDDGRFIRHLEECGARVGSGDPKLTVVVCDDYLALPLAEVNRRRLATQGAVDAGAAAGHGGAVRPRLSRGQARTLLGLFGVPLAQPSGGPRLSAQRCRRGGRLQAVRGPARGAGCAVRADGGRDRQVAGAG